MEDEILDRIKKLNSFKSESAFAKELNVGQKSFNQQMRGINALSLKLVTSVLEWNKDLSAEWLMRGNGAMLLSKDDNNASANLAMRQAQIIVDQHEEIARLNQIIDGLEKGARHHLEILKKEQKQNTVLK